MLVLGCTMVGPDYVRPPVQVEQTWMDTGDQRVQTASANYKDWWQAFKDPALNQLIDTAYRENLTLRIAGVRVLAARAQLGIAIGQLYPQTQASHRLGAKRPPQRRRAFSGGSQLHRLSEELVWLKPRSG